jgi:hypothetical protein
LFLFFAFATLGVLACTLLGRTTRFFLRLLAGLLFLGAATSLGFKTLALTALVLDALGFAAYRFLGLATLLVYLVLLLTRLLFEHIALDVSALPSDFDVDGTSTPLRTGEFELALCLATERDLAGSRITIIAAAVAAAQMREQLEFRIVTDAIVGTRDFDTGLIELHQQPIHRHLQYFCKLGNCYFCHALPRPHWPA